MTERTECPACGITWVGEEIPDGLMQHAPRRYTTRKQAEEAAAAYGWTPENRRTFSVNVMGIEYPYTHPQHYDGVSEWKCVECGARFNRFTGEQLEEDDCVRIR